MEDKSMNTSREHLKLRSHAELEEGKQPELPPLNTPQGRGWRMRRGRGPARRLMLLTLVLALGAAAWYVPGLRQYLEVFSQIPAVRESMTSLQEGFEVVRNDVRRWAAEQDALKEHLAALDAKVTTGIDAARRQASALSAAMEQRLAERLEARAGRIDRRIEELDSVRTAEGSRVARLEEEMVHLRHSVARLDDRMLSVDGVPRQLAGLERRIDENESDLRRTESRLEEEEQVGSKRFDFELPKASTRQLAPGIVAHLTRTNVKFQRYDGWLRLVEEGRTLWIRDQSILQPLIFYEGAGNGQHEFVVTRLSGDTAIGYLKIPQEADGHWSLSLLGRSRAGE
jgi:predicted  nucleic acid-binding Zn-ribbon protein